LKLGPAARRIFLLGLGVWAGGKLCAAPAVFRVPVEPASRAILDFAQQARIEVLFPYDQLQRVKSAAIDGSYEPEEALTRLLQGTGFVARKNGRGTFVVVAAPKTPPSRPAPQPSPVEASSAPGSRQEAATPLDAVLVNAQTENNTRMHLGTADVAAGNLDMDRTAEDALPYTVIDRSRIVTSGADNLNDFLRRELLESDAASQSVDQQGQSALFLGGSTNLNLRGYGDDETLVLVNGRELPQVLSGGVTNGSSYTTRQPDVNLIPLSLVERVEVLPVSASAVYSGDPVGGVVNIILRPVENVTEITANYSNALHSFDAPQSTLSLLHGETLLGGKLQLRLDADFTQIVPPTEAELGYIQKKLETYPNLDGPLLFRATPNITTVPLPTSTVADPLPPLFGPGTPSTASVAPGADGSGGYAALAARAGVPSLALFRAPGGMDDSPDSIDYSYGRQEKSSEYYFSAIYDVTSRLQIAWDGLYSHAVSHNGYSVFPETLSLTQGTPLDPFNQTVQVMLNETAPKLGGTYDEAQRNVYSSVLGALLKLPADWRLSLDTQYSESVIRYRGLAGVDSAAWQKLVDEGIYNPLRDTQVYGPPQAFYDQVLLYFGGPGKFVTLDDYQNLTGAVRLARTTLPLPTGTGSVNLGADFTRDRLADFDDTQVYGNGTIADTSGLWGGRTLERYSVFGELQAPLLPAQWLPKWIKQVQMDAAARYVASDTAGGAHVSPTVALKVDFPGGLSARASISNTNRFPTPTLSRFTPTVPGTAGTGAAGAVTGTSIQDPLRGNSTYTVQSSDTPDEAVNPEADLTRSVGLVYRHGTKHRFTASLDFFDTHKSDELDYLAAQDVIGLEAELPGRVIRAPVTPGDPYGVGMITSVLTGNINVASRASQDWNLSLDYTESDVFGGAITIYTRWVYFQSFERQLLGNSGVVDELDHPDVASLELMRNRLNFGGEWADKRNAFGIDAEYFGTRQLPEFQWVQQQSHNIAPYFQVDAFGKTDLTRFLPWEKSRYRLSLQLRVNNVFSARFPKYIDDPSGSGLGAYGDWRGRVYSISVTATF
jgi:outer membrane receptor protein involved in Fe transport